MNLENSIKIKPLSDEAVKQFDQLQNRLDTVRNNLDRRSGGKTRFGLFMRFIFSGIWLVVYFILFMMVRTGPAFLVFLGAMGLLAVMVLDNLVSLKYYGKIFHFRNNLTHLKERVEMGKRNVYISQEQFMEAAKNGWNLPLTPAESIPQEASSIDGALAGLESLRSGFLNGLKNVLYYVVGLAVTVISGIAMMPIAEGFIYDLMDARCPGWVMYIFIGLACLIQFLLAKLIWGKSDCRVSNRTLFGTLLGPVLCLALCYLAPLVAAGVSWLISAIISLASLIIGCVCFYTWCCGG